MSALAHVRSLLLGVNTDAIALAAELLMGIRSAADVLRPLADAEAGARSRAVDPRPVRFKRPTMSQADSRPFTRDEILHAIDLRDRLRLTWPEIGARTGRGRNSLKETVARFRAGKWGRRAGNAPGRPTQRPNPDRFGRRQ